MELSSATSDERLSAGFHDVTDGQKWEKKEQQVSGVLTSLAEEVDGVGQLGFLQLQLTLLNELKHLAVPKDGEFWGNPGPLLQNLSLQLHVAVRNQLTHHRLTLDLEKRRC